MMVTGIRLIQAIRRHTLRRDTAAGQFDDSLLKFEGEDKLSPQQIADNFMEAEEAVAKIQTALSVYNTLVMVNVGDRKMCLAEAVKRLGGAGRVSKMWRGACGAKKDRYAYSRDETRKLDEIRARPTVSIDQAMKHADQAAAFAGALRTAIALGNTTELSVDVLKLDPRLLTE